MQIQTKVNETLNIKKSKISKELTNQFGHFQ